MIENTEWENIKNRSTQIGTFVCAQGFIILNEIHERCIEESDGHFPYKK